MHLNIKERCQKVLQSLSMNAQRSIREIAAATGIPKSSVHRHLGAIRRRQQHPESSLWETPEGGEWLRLLVFGVIYCFGIKGGIGSDSLSEFFHLLRLEERIGCSASALRRLEVEVNEQIIAYGKTQAAASQGESPTGICVGADETFYGLPILVAVELSSGFIFTEVACANRTYDTWWEQVSEWFKPEQWDCRFMVSDGAKALVKLALSGLGCPSVPDLFHLLYGLSKSLGTSLGRQQSQLQKQMDTLQAKLQTSTTSATCQVLNAQIAAVQTQQQQLTHVHQVYQQSVQVLSQSLHPFNINTDEAQLGSELPTQLQAPLCALEPLTQTYAPTQSQAALALWHRQVPALAGVLQAWWQWVLSALPTQTPDPDTQNWVLTLLLPWVYWHQQMHKTRQPQLKLTYQHAAQRAYERFRADAFTQSRSTREQQQWIDWALWICAKFQRTSSAVEGRNGYLSRLHHAHRGFTDQRLQVLTIIHNFDLKRHDGSTAAQRLFGKSFPILFEAVVANLGDLTRPRRTLKTPKSQKPTVQTVPA